jgi:2-amino-4-hydroxy-6-hydroxymethyldihydropteridine diphosphokinase
MKIAYLGLGSNLGDRKKYLDAATEMIGEQVGEILLCSGVYETAAWGVDDQPNYYNQVIKIQTNLYPLELLKQILSVETALGRERIIKWGPRTIDIDFLFYEDYYFSTPELTLPHPWISSRNFVLAPLTEISPDLVHPVFKKKIHELFQQCTDQAEIRRI